MSDSGKRLVSGSSHAFPLASWITGSLIGGIGVAFYVANSSRPEPGAQAGLLVIVTLTSLIALGLFWHATQVTLRHLRYRGLQLELVPETAVAGEEFVGTLVVPVAFRAGREFKVELSAVELTAVREADRKGDGYSYREIRSPLHGDSCSALASASGTGTLLHFSFRLPADARPSLGYAESVAWTSLTANRVYVKWHLGLKADVPGIDLDESFEIPVVLPDTREQASPAGGNASFVLEDGASAVSVRQPAWRKPGRSEWVTDLFGLSAAVLAVVLFQEAGGLLTGLMLTPLAALWAAIVAYHAQELAVSISSAEVRITRRVGAHTLTDARIGRAQIKTVEVVPAFGRYAGGLAPRTVRVRTADGGSCALAEFMTSPRDVLALCRLLAERLALPPQAVVGASGLQHQVHVYEASAPWIKRVARLALLALAGFLLWPWVSAFYEGNRGDRPAKVAPVQTVSAPNAEQPRAPEARATPAAPAIEAPTKTPAVSPWWTRLEHAMAENSARRFTEAEQELRSILSDVEREAGPGHPFAGLLHYHLAMIHGNQRRIAEREAELKRALEIFEGESIEVVRAALGPMGWTLDREVVARDLGDLLWGQRRAADAYGYYEKAYAAAAKLGGSEEMRNDRLALSAAGVMVTACTLQKWDVAEKAMAEVRWRYLAASPYVQPKLKYWIDTGEPRLKARNCS